MRIRDYRKNVDQPEAVLNGLELVDGRAMCGWLDSIASNYEGEVTTSCDRSEKITLQVRSDEASVAEATAKTLYTIGWDSGFFCYVIAIIPLYYYISMFVTGNNEKEKNEHIFTPMIWSFVTLVILLATIAAMLLCFAIRLYVRATRNGENNLAS